MYSTVGEPVGTAAGEEEETTCYESFIAHHPQGSFMQSSRWAQVKSQWGCERILLWDETGAVCTAMQENSAFSLFVSVRAPRPGRKLSGGRRGTGAIDWFHPGIVPAAPCVSV